jgi:membrane associated rhomboid family serine protease
MTKPSEPSGDTGGRSVWLRRPPFFDHAIGAAAVLFGSLAVGVSMGAPMLGIAPLDCAPYAFAIAVVLTLAARALTRPRSERAIELGETQLGLPPDARSRARAIPYEELVSLYVAGKGRSRRFVVDADRRGQVYRLDAFVDPAAPEQIIATVRARLARLPKAELLLARLDAQTERERSAASVQPWLTVMVTVVLVLSAGYVRWSGATGDPHKLVPLGASARALLLDGQWLRLASSTVLHAGLHDLLYVVTAFTLLSTCVEPQLGTARTALIMLTCALVSSALAAYDTVTIWAGAGGAVVGLCGAIVVLQLRFRAEMTTAVRSNGLTALLCALALGAPRKGEYLGVYAACFLTGTLVTLGLCRRAADVRPGAPAGPFIKGSAWALGALFLVSVAWPFTRSVEAKQRDLLLVSSHPRPQSSRVPW